MIFDNHSNLKYKFGQRTFWAKGYYVSTVGLNKNTIRSYIKNQELEDKISDSRNIKEYQDPFKGVQVEKAVDRLKKDPMWGQPVIYPYRVH